MSGRAEHALPTPVRLFLRPEVPLLALVAIGLGYRLWRAWQDIPTLVRKVTADDAYYYFEIARNISNGHNITFDGETLTNGFHPLWLVLVTPVYFFTDDLETGVHISLTIGAVLGAATIALVFLIGRELTDNGWAALAGATFFAIHPYIVVDSVNGMETAVTVFTMALTVWLFIRVARRNEAGLAWYAALGLAGGLMLLARTDTIFVMAAIGIFLLARKARTLAWDGPVVTGAVALAVVSPWLIWNLLTFETIVQVSSVAIPDLTRDIVLHKHGDSLDTQVDFAWRFTKGALTDSLVRQYFVYPFAQGRWVFLISLGAGLALMLIAPFSPQRQQVTRQVGLLAVPAVGVFATLIYHAAYRWVLREWYYAPFTLIGSTLVTIGVAYLHSVLQGTRLAWRNGADGDKRPLLREQRWIAIAGMYGAVALLLLLVYGPQQADRWVDRRSLGHRVNMLEGANWLRENTAEDARIGSFNSGIIGYFSDRQVINLDGVVNEDAYHARLDCDISDYMVQQRIQYLAELEAEDEIPRIDGLGMLPCGEPPCLNSELLVKVGKVLGYFGGGQIDVLELTPVRRPDCPSSSALVLLPADE